MQGLAAAIGVTTFTVCAVLIFLAMINDARSRPGTGRRGCRPDRDEWGLM